MKNALEIILDHSRAGAALRESFFRENAEKIRLAAFETALRIAKGGKLLLCGNGGSAADAQHVAGEFVNRFLIDRPGLPAIALTTDTSVITAIANDSSFDNIFARQVEALGRPGDALFAISTSGNSANVLAALAEAGGREIFRIALTGHEGGKMADMCDLLLNVPDARTPLIQEVHLACEHLFCQLTDYYLFENVGELAPFMTRN